MNKSAIPLEEAKEYVSYEPETGAFYWLPREKCQGFAAKKVGCRADKDHRTNERYVSRRVSYASPSGKRRFMAHRLAWAFVHGDIPSGKEVDHINGDPCDNRIENLRLVTRAQNNRNTATRHDNRSGYPGVKRKPNGKWFATAGACGRVWLGSHDTFEAAVEAKKAWEADRGFHPNHGRAA